MVFSRPFHVRLLYAYALDGNRLKLALLIALTIAHLAGPGLAECPMVTEVQALRQRVKQLEGCELKLIRLGWHRDLSGRWWK